MTGVPSGKTNEGIINDLDYFISSPDCSDEDEIDNNDQDQDEHFVYYLTFSRFRRDMILYAVNEFPEEYSVEKKSLGSTCKLFLSKQWNSSCWTEITSTQVFHEILKEQMSTKSRVKDGKLCIRLSFGRPKRGFEFESMGEVHSYTDKDNG